MPKMSDYKYTNDGKKVIVVGKLNAQETIVQEIFVSNGQEIPSGENFVVLSLHDAPSESWREKNIKESKKNYDGELQELERFQKKLRISIGKAREQADSLFKFAENSNVHELDLLRDFLSGKITHFAFPNSYYPEIRTSEDNKLFHTDRSYGNENMKIEGMKLVSLFGRTDGSLEYRLNQYRDGSGTDIIVVPCRSYSEAVEVMQKHLDEISARYTDKEASKNMSMYVEEWEKIEGIVISDEVIKKNKNQQAKKIGERIETLRADLKKEEEKLQGIQELSDSETTA